MEKFGDSLKGRGAAFNPDNPYSRTRLDATEIDGIDEALTVDPKTEILWDHPSKVVNKITSPDLPMAYSVNPYQGCEHGCAYCYARNAHSYWGLSAGLDFERKIIVKQGVPDRLREHLDKKSWKARPIMFSGNTDCYQPLERSLELTRQCLEVLAEYRNPVGIITKNALVLRDLPILKQMAELGLVHVHVSITTLDESLRRSLEPRTSTAKQRLRIIRELSEAGIPTGVMIGPVIPGLNHHEIPKILKESAEAGAVQAGYTFVRLNGDVGAVFEAWIREAYPDRAEKVLGQIREAHGGKLSDSRFGVRMRGEGKMAESIQRLFRMFREKYFSGRSMPEYDLSHFRRPDKGQLSLF
ncbi:PA0069 family radical SAM protein [Pontibacter sp. G13]|uniref:PA0069 family radical SAM protein n=1 Tax=Pontibacter sp. G13 TaxID=3074898 RepID=UPI00288A063E|nr:PA0069 family radical SAM protein [Pontibacter sp. G13]WNJ18560.1 PA0069 family radical SAM protein [Pontibacter sp. G13]